MAHGRSYSNGYVQWRIFELRIGGVCYGEPVCGRYHRRLYRTLPDVVLGSCHFGNIIEYDTVTNLSWSVDVRTHAIAQMVDKVLSEPWAAANELGLEVPPSKRQDDCLVSSRVTSHKVEFFSHRCGTAAGLLQMGLWKLQPMINNHFFRDAHTRLRPQAPKSITTSYGRRQYIVLERVFRDGLATRRSTGRTYNPWKCFFSV